MPNPVNITNITPPRVQLADPNTGLVSREWFRFFQSLFQLTGSGQNDFTLQDLQIGPDGDAASLAAVLQTEIQNLSVSPPYTPQLPRRRYGSFYDTTTQTAAAINTAYAMTFNTTRTSEGITLGTPTSRVYADTLATYNIQFSVQVNTTVATDQLLWVWLRKNGTNVTASTSQVRTKVLDFAAVVTKNFLLEMNPGDYFELMWATDSTGVQLQTFAASGFYPSVPSVALTVTNNIGSEGNY
jgi:hypothetical protein